MAQHDQEFPQKAWEIFRCQPAVNSLLTPALGPWSLSSYPSPSEWQLRSTAVEGFQKLNLNFALEKKPGQRRKRKLVKAEQRSYEQWIFEDGNIPTRADNAHDFFNAIIWLRFPKAKQALHYRSLLDQRAWPEAPEYEPGRRSRLRDRLTCIDEGGVILVFPTEAESEAARALMRGPNEAEKKAFILAHKDSCLIFGHALLEQALLSLSQGERIPRLNASCVFLVGERPEVDEDLAEYLTQLQADGPWHGSIPVDWLLATD